MARLPDEIEQLRDSVRSYFDRTVTPIIGKYETSRGFPWEILPAVYEFGYVRGVVPTELGGDATTHLVQAVLMEEAGRCWGSLRTTVNVQSMVARLLAAAASEDQRARFLEPQLAGRRFGWFALTESEAGSDAGALRTRAHRTANGWSITGRKLYITNALDADFGIVLARVDDESSGRGVTAFLVDRAESTYQVHDLPHLPVRATSSCELVFDETEVPAENQLGDIGAGLRLAMAVVNLGRLNMAMGAVGLSQACLELSSKHARARSQFGRPIAGFQLVQQMIVEIATLTQTSRLLGYDAAEQLDAGGDGRYACSMAKYYAGESAGRAATIALQVHGGAGLMEESPVERYFRDAREATIPEGTSQIQVLQMGKHLLGVSALR